MCFVKYVIAYSPRSKRSHGHRMVDGNIVPHAKFQDAELVARAVALRTGASEELGNRYAGPTTTLTGCDAVGVKVIGDGLCIIHCACCVCGLDLSDDVANEVLDLLPRHRASPQAGFNLTARRAGQQSRACQGA